MSDSQTKRMLRSYVEQSPAPLFLAGFFESPAENFHTSESIEFDIERSGEEVAVVVQDLSSSGRKNESTLYTNKEFTPPVYKEEASIPAHKLIDRQPGQDPFVSPNYAANAIRKTSSVLRKMQRKITRGVELMASQVLQNGTLTLVDSGGNSLFTMDFSPKTTHFTTTAGGVAWSSTSTATPLSDLETMADTILHDGKAPPFRLVMGKNALRNFLANDGVRNELDNRRMNLGAIGRPEVRGAGGRFHGEVSVGPYTFEIWSYTGFYEDPQTGAATKFVGDDNVIMLGDGRLDLTFGDVPRIAPPDPRAMPFLPPRISGAEQGIDMHLNTWLEPDGQTLTVSVASRPLTIPTAIDTFGRIDTSS